MMQIFVRGTCDENTITLDVLPQFTISEIKDLIELKTGIPSYSQRLNYGLHTLDDCLTLEESSIQSESTLFHSIELLGGGKKRKKKVFPKPKKNKHKKKKVKLAVLKFYKVDANDQITRLRKQCVQCGPGVFMAAHKTRSYCGRCGDVQVNKE